jgi:hypothetical protein
MGPVGKKRLQNGSLALERHDITRTDIAIGVARDVGYRLAGLAVHRDAIRVANLCVVIGDNCAVPRQRVDDLIMISADGGAVFLVADLAVNACEAVGTEGS